MDEEMDVRVGVRFHVLTFKRHIRKHQTLCVRGEKELGNWKISIPLIRRATVHCPIAETHVLLLSSDEVLVSPKSFSYKYCFMDRDREGTWEQLHRVSGIANRWFSNDGQSTDIYDAFTLPTKSEYEKFSDKCLEIFTYVMADIHFSDGGREWELFRDAICSARDRDLMSTTGRSRQHIFPNGGRSISRGITQWLNHRTYGDISPFRAVLYCNLFTISDINYSSFMRVSVDSRDSFEKLLERLPVHPDEIKSSLNNLHVYDERSLSDVVASLSVVSETSKMKWVRSLPLLHALHREGPISRLQVLREDGELFAETIQSIIGENSVPEWVDSLAFPCAPIQSYVHFIRNGLCRTRSVLRQIIQRKTIELRTILSILDELTRVPPSESVDKEVVELANEILGSHSRNTGIYTPRAPSQQLKRLTRDIIRGYVRFFKNLRILSSSCDPVIIKFLRAQKESFTREIHIRPDKLNHCVQLWVHDSEDYRLVLKELLDRIDEFRYLESYEVSTVGNGWKYEMLQERLMRAVDAISRGEDGQLNLFHRLKRWFGMNRTSSACSALSRIVCSSIERVSVESVFQWRLLSAFINMQQNDRVEFTPPAKMKVTQCISLLQRLQESVRSGSVTPLDLGIIGRKERFSELYTALGYSEGQIANSVAEIEKYQRIVECARVRERLLIRFLALVRLVDGWNDCDTAHQLQSLLVLNVQFAHQSVNTLDASFRCNDKNTERILFPISSVYDSALFQRIWKEGIRSAPDSLSSLTEGHALARISEFDGLYREIVDERILLGRVENLFSFTNGNLDIIMRELFHLSCCSISYRTFDTNSSDEVELLTKMEQFSLSSADRLIAEKVQIFFSLLHLRKSASCVNECAKVMDVMLLNDGTMRTLQAQMEMNYSNESLSTITMDVLKSIRVLEKLDESQQEFLEVLSDSRILIDRYKRMGTRESIRQAIDFMRGNELSLPFFDLLGDLDKVYGVISPLLDLGNDGPVPVERFITVCTELKLSDENLAAAVTSLVQNASKISAAEKVQMGDRRKQAVDDVESLWKSGVLNVTDSEIVVEADGKRWSEEELVDLQSLIDILNGEERNFSDPEIRSLQNYSDNFVNFLEYAQKLKRTLRSIVESGGIPRREGIFMFNENCDVESAQMKAIEILRSACERVENELKLTRNRIKIARKKYKILNHFTIRQLRRISTSLQAWSPMHEQDESGNELDSEAFSMLRCIASDLSVVWKSRISTMDPTLWLEKLSGDNWLDHLHDILSSLSREESSTCLKSNNLKVVVCSPREVINQVLSLYYECREMPTLKTCLFCRPDTWEEEVEIFLLRCFQDRSSNLYCFANVQELQDYVQSRATDIIVNYIQEGRGFNLAIVGQKSARMIDQLSRFEQKNSNTGLDELQKFFFHGDDFGMKQIFAVEGGAGTGKSWTVEQEANGCPIYNVVLTNSSATSLVDRLPYDGGTFLSVDIGSSVRGHLDAILFSYCVLGSIVDRRGYMRHRGDFRVALELQSSGENDNEKFSFFSIAPKCHLPSTPRQIVDGEGNDLDREVLENNSFQRICQYLQHYERGADLDAVSAGIENRMNNLSAQQCISVLVAHCGSPDPCWRTLMDFYKFVKTEVDTCLNSDFVVFSGDGWGGFRKFLLTFVFRSCTDFSTATPSRSGSEDSVGVERMNPRRKWESSDHPYIFFPPGSHCPQFFSVRIDKNGYLLSENGKRLENDYVMNPNLRNAIELQLAHDKLSLNDDYNRWDRQKRIEFLCRAFGCYGDPDSDYELTTDNMRKILAVYFRMLMDTPVILMGETGCGKTALLKYMAKLMDAEFHRILCHGGVTEDDLRCQIRNLLESVKVKQTNIILFIDELNACEAVDFLKSLFLDRVLDLGSLTYTQRISGSTIDIDEYMSDCRFKFYIVGACNPYIVLSEDMKKKLETSGLGFSGRDTHEINGIPLRHLVYRVHPLTESMMQYVWDFGRLTDDAEHIYIDKILSRDLETGGLLPSNNHRRVMCRILHETQKCLREYQDECSYVSLRDIKRFTIVFRYFLNMVTERFPNIDELLSAVSSGSDWIPMGTHTLAFIFSLFTCYEARLGEDRRQEYEQRISRIFEAPFALQNGVSSYESALSRFMTLIVSNLVLPHSIALNAALTENFFMMVTCCELKIPLFVVGKPGTSKSLAKSIIRDNLQGAHSKSEFFRKFKRIGLLSFQCSPHTTSAALMQTVEKVTRIHGNKTEKEKENSVEVLFLDEVGLAEDSPDLPLKVLHHVMKEVDEEQVTGIIGISNWALDPAKMNRALHNTREEPSVSELQITATGLCRSQNGEIHSGLPPLIVPICNLYSYIRENCQPKERSDFFGLRDLYSVFSTLSQFSDINRARIEDALHQNFDARSTLERIKEQIETLPVLDNVDESSQLTSISPLQILKNGYETTGRYLLVMSDSDLSALDVLFDGDPSILERGTEVLFGSRFHGDQNYAQVCRYITRVKHCMEVGHTIVLVETDELYESLYDLMNQYFMMVSNRKYVEIGLGQQIMYAFVDDSFRLIIVANRHHVYKDFPIPLLNRLEKHELLRFSLLSDAEKSVVENLERYVKEFGWIHAPSDKEERYSRYLVNSFAGLGKDSEDVQDGLAAMVTYARNSLNQNMDDSEQLQQLVECARSLLLRTATPDAVMRHKGERECSLYFDDEAHDSFESAIAQGLEVARKNRESLRMMVTTYTHVLPVSRLQSISSPRMNNTMVMPVDSVSTSQEFSRQLKLFFRSLSGLLVIQFSVKHVRLLRQIVHLVESMESEMKTSTDSTHHVVFLLHMRRDSSLFRNFRCVARKGWKTVHVDSLVPPLEGFPAISVLRNFTSVYDVVSSIGIKKLLLHCIPSSVALLHPVGRNESTFNPTMLSTELCKLLGIPEFLDDIEEKLRPGFEEDVLWNLVKIDEKLVSSMGTFSGHVFHEVAGRVAERFARLLSIACSNFEIDVFHRIQDDINMRNMWRSIWRSFAHPSTSPSGIQNRDFVDVTMDYPANFPLSSLIINFVEQNRTEAEHQAEVRGGSIHSILYNAIQSSIPDCPVDELMSIRYIRDLCSVAPGVHPSRPSKYLVNVLTEYVRNVVERRFRICDVQRLPKMVSEVHSVFSDKKKHLRWMESVCFASDHFAQSLLHNLGSLLSDESSFGNKLLSSVLGELTNQVGQPAWINNYLHLKSCLTDMLDEVGLPEYNRQFSHLYMCYLAEVQLGASVPNYSAVLLSHFQNHDCAKSNNGLDAVLNFLKWTCDSLCSFKKLRQGLSCSCEADTPTSRCPTCDLLHCSNCRKEDNTCQVCLHQLNPLDADEYRRDVLSIGNHRKRCSRFLLDCVSMDSRANLAFDKGKRDILWNILFDIHDSFTKYIEEAYSLYGSPQFKLSILRLLLDTAFSLNLSESKRIELEKELRGQVKCVDRNRVLSSLLHIGSEISLRSAVAPFPVGIVQECTNYASEKMEPIRRIAEVSSSIGRCRYSLSLAARVLNEESDEEICRSVAANVGKLCPNNRSAWMFLLRSVYHGQSGGMRSTKKVAHRLVKQFPALGKWAKEILRPSGNESVLMITLKDCEKDSDFWNLITTYLEHHSLHKASGDVEYIYTDASESENTQNCGESSEHIRKLLVSLRENEYFSPDDHIFPTRQGSEQWNATYENTQLLIIHTTIAVATSSRDSALSIFKDLLVGTTQWSSVFLPTMDDPIDADVLKIGGVTKLAHCGTCGFIYGIGDCGKPSQVSTCTQCGKPIGGMHSGNDIRFEQNNAYHEISSETRMGYDPRVGIEGVRMISLGACGLLRVLLDSIIFGSATFFSGDRIGMQISALREQMHRDLNRLSEVLSMNLESCFCLLHALLIELGRLRISRYNLRIKEQRDQWEEDVTRSCINAILSNSQERLQDFRTSLSSSDGHIVKQLGETIFSLVKGHKDINDIDPCKLRWAFYRIPSLGECACRLQQGEKKYELLELFLNAVPLLKYCRHLPGVINLQRFAREYASINELDATMGKNLSLREILHKLNPIERKNWGKSIESYRLAWDGMRRNILKLLPTGDFKLNELFDMYVKEWGDREFTEEVTLSWILTSNHGEGICSTALTLSLIRVHNDFLGDAFEILKEKTAAPYGTVSASDVKSHHIVSFSLQEELESVLSRFYDVFGDEYDFDGLQDFVCENYVRGKLKLQGALTEHSYAREVISLDTIEGIKRTIRQARICQSTRAAIIDTVTKRSALRTSLHWLEVTISFLKHAHSGETDHDLSEFLQSVLHLPREHPLTNLALEMHFSYSHVIPIWGALDLENSIRQMEMKEDPFVCVTSELSEVLPEDVAIFYQSNIFRTVDLFPLLLKLREMLLLAFHQRHSWPMDTNTALGYYLIPYVDRTDEDADWVYTTLPTDGNHVVLMKHAISFWRLAAKEYRRFQWEKNELL